MRRVLALVPVCLLWLGSLAASAQTVDELIARNTEAKGGLDRLKAVETVKQTSELTMPGTRATVVVYGKRPNLLRQEISMSGTTIVNGFDGEVPWVINPLIGTRGPMAVTGPQADAIRDQSNFDGPLIDYRARGLTIELAGTEVLDGRKAFRLRITGGSGQAQDCYLDAETGLEVRIVTRTDVGSFEQEMSDYREVDGIKVPFAIRTLFNGVSQTEIAVKSVQFNVPIDDALFAPPAQ